MGSSPRIPASSADHERRPAPMLYKILLVVCVFESLYVFALLWSPSSTSYVVITLYFYVIRAVFGSTCVLVLCVCGCLRSRRGFLFLLFSSLSSLFVALLFRASLRFLGVAGGDVLEWFFSFVSQVAVR